MVFDNSSRESCWEYLFSLFDSDEELMCEFINNDNRMNKNFNLSKKYLSNIHEQEKNMAHEGSEKAIESLRSTFLHYMREYFIEMRKIIEIYENYIPQKSNE